MPTLPTKFNGPYSQSRWSTYMHDHPSKTGTLHVYRNLNQSLPLRPFQNNTHKKPPLGLFLQTFKHENDRDRREEWAVGERLALRRFVRVLRIEPPWQISNCALVASSTKDARSPTWAWFWDKKQGMEWLFNNNNNFLCETCKLHTQPIPWLTRTLYMQNNILEYPIYTQGCRQGGLGGAEATLGQKFVLSNTIIAVHCLYFEGRISKYLHICT